MKNHLSNAILVFTVLISSIVFAGNATDASTSTNESTGQNSEQNKNQLEAILALDGDAEYGEYLAGECSTCHVSSGGDGSIPSIHGLPKDYLASALLEYKNQQRGNVVMQGVASALGDEELAALVEYFSQQ